MPIEVSVSFSSMETYLTSALSLKPAPSCTFDKNSTSATLFSFQ